MIELEIVSKTNTDCSNLASELMHAFAQKLQLFYTMVIIQNMYLAPRYLGPRNQETLALQ